jgi:L-fuculose-phosphate aldolase
MNERKWRELICKIGQLMHSQGYIDGTAGNITVRLDAERVLATPSGLAKGFMEPDELIIVNMDGERVDDPTESNAHLKPTSELLMHLECYKRRPDIGGVVHAHPPHAVALTIAGYDFAQCLIPEMVVILGIVPVTPYAHPASAENRDAITELIRQHDAIMLAHHGSLTVGPSVWDAYLKLESLEHAAKILATVEQLGGVRSHIPPEKVRLLLEARRDLGLFHEGDEERLAPFM